MIELEVMDDTRKARNDDTSSSSSASEDDGEVGDEMKGPMLKPALPTSPRRTPGRQFWKRDIAPCLPARYVTVAITLLGFFCLFTLRSNISMAIVAMVNNTAAANSSTHLQFDWSSTQQGWILSSFYYGYLVLQIPGGYLSDMFGARYVFGIGVLVPSILTLFTPLAAELHIAALIVLRIFIGMVESVTFPAAHSLLGKWSPPNERSIMTTVTYSGSFFGYIISFPLTALLCEYGFAGGWPSVFYVFGCTGLIWFVGWLCLAFDSPATHPRISAAERMLIETSIEKEGTGKIKEKIPWIPIMTSPAVWGIIIAQVCNTWGFYTLSTCIPSYYSDVLNLKLGKNMLQNGLYSSIPYVGFLVVSIATGQLSDLLRKKGVRVVIIMKSFVTIAFLVSAVALLSISYIGSSTVGCVLLLTVSVSFSGFIGSSLPVNMIDIAPQFAGLMMGITSTANTIPGIVAPLIAKMIAHVPALGPNDTATYREEWQEVFIIAAEVYIFGAIVYIILGQGERQWWAGGKDGGKMAAKKPRTDSETIADSKDFSIQKLP